MYKNIFYRNIKISSTFSSEAKDNRKEEEKLFKY